MTRMGIHFHKGRTIGKLMGRAGVGRRSTKKIFAEGKIK